MKNLLLTLMGIFLLGTATINAEEKTPTSKETKTLHMKIEGMTCSMCPAMIQEKLSSLCESVLVDYKTAQGECTYQIGKTNEENIVKAVTDAGFKVVETK